MSSLSKTSYSEVSKESRLPRHSAAARLQETGYPVSHGRTVPGLPSWILGLILYGSGYWLTRTACMSENIGKCMSFMVGSIDGVCYDSV